MTKAPAAGAHNSRSTNMLTPAKPNEDRSLLRFEEAVLHAFAFLASGFGFRVTDTQLTRVRYESSTAFVNIFHGRSSYEVGCEVGPLGQTGTSVEQYSLWEVCQLEGVPGVSSRSFLQASTREAVEAAVERAATLLHNHGRRALEGEKEYFEALERARSAWFQREQSEARLAHVRPAVDDAWARHDYRSVVALLEKLSAVLTPAERKKLDYARAKSSALYL